MNLSSHPIHDALIQNFFCMFTWLWLHITYQQHAKEITPSQVNEKEKSTIQADMPGEFYQGSLRFVVMSGINRISPTTDTPLSAAGTSENDVMPMQAWV